MNQQTRVPRDDTVDLREWADVLFRRRRLFLTTTGALCVASLLAAMLWPATYRSIATILIEKQDVPADLVPSAVTSSAVERIETISQQVMTRANLLAIIEKYDMFAEAREENRLEGIVESLRRRIKIDTVDVDVADPRSGRAARTAIAFTVAYESGSPELTQTVTEEVASLFLEQNRRSRSDSATETVEFLTTEAGLLGIHITDLEAELAAFKEQNVTRLPELADLNLRLMESAERQLASADAQIRSLDERRHTLEGDLALVSPWGPMVSATGDPVVDPASLLRALRSEYIGLSARYTANHPDVVRLRREIGALEAAIGAVDITEGKQQELSRLRNSLAASLDRYTEAHPDVVRLRRAIAVLEAAPDQTTTASGGTDLNLAPDNPAYITLRARLNAVDGELVSLREYREYLAGRTTDLEQRIVEGPAIERDYLALSREYDTAVARYREIRDSENDARMRMHLEAEHAEHFSLIDPAQVPEDPIKPNRILIALLGVMFSLTGGFAAVISAEALGQKGGTADNPQLGLAEQTIAALQREIALLRGEVESLPGTETAAKPTKRGRRA